MAETSQQNPAPETPNLVSPRIERWQQRFMNPVAARLAGRVPFFSEVRHVGRRSGRDYTTTVRALVKRNRVAIILVHGAGDWVKNVRAAGTFEIALTRRTISASNIRIVPAGSRDRSLPLAAQLFLRRSAVLVADIA